MEDSTSTANQDQIQELNATLSQMIEVLHTSGCNMKVVGFVNKPNKFKDN